MHRISQGTELADESGGTFADQLGIRPVAPFLVGDAVMEELPHQAAQAIGDGPHRNVVLFRVAAADPVVMSFKHRTFRLDGCMGRLVEDAAHGPVALGRAVAFGFFGRFLPPRTGSHPGA